MSYDCDIINTVIDIIMLPVHVYFLLDSLFFIINILNNFNNCNLFLNYRIPFRK